MQQQSNKQYHIIGLNNLHILVWHNINKTCLGRFKTAEEGRAKICKFLWQKLKNKSNIEKHIMNNFRTNLEHYRTNLEQFKNSFRIILELFNNYFRPYLEEM